MLDSQLSSYLSVGVEYVAMEEAKVAAIADFDRLTASQGKGILRPIAGTNFCRKGSR